MEGPHRLSLSDTCRLQRSVEADKQALKSRIAYFKREEEKIWRNLDEVRRHAKKLEQGRASAMERRQSLRELERARKLREIENAKKALELKANLGITKEQHLRNKEEALATKKEATRRARKESAEIVRMKRVSEANDRAVKSKKAVAIQQASIEGKLQVKAEREKRLRKLREAAERKRLGILANAKAEEAELSALEEEEMRCLQRLQNSRMVSQSVLQDLEASLGQSSPLCSMLKSRTASALAAGNGLPWSPEFSTKSKFHSYSTRFGPPPRTVGRSEPAVYVNTTKGSLLSSQLAGSLPMVATAVESEDEGPPKIGGTPSKIGSRHQGSTHLLEEALPSYATQEAKG
ncbi:54S ribosomal protein L2 mitochondrial [Perkinsus chesapeaki]|uniref:54S ribosomal protein L2 mitochondrial n=1 Tax=Perkinsus chesapeaki TaxID=330153 RepID=A0A7J6LPU7_PERCH|nr:54S ribosomal protein L2 mitochondrial [Perkinsus chesapeaki]